MTSTKIEIVIQNECDRLLRGRAFDQCNEAEVLVSLRRVANVSYQEGATAELKPTQKAENPND